MSIHDEMLEYNFKNKIAAYPTSPADFSELKGTFVSETIVFKNVTLTNTGNEITNVVGKIIPTISGAFSVIPPYSSSYDYTFDIRDKNGVSVSDGTHVNMKAFNEYTIYTRSSVNATRDIEVTIKFRVEDVTNYIIKG